MAHGASLCIRCRNHLARLLVVKIQKKKKRWVQNLQILTYCWWTKSCTSWYGSLSHCWHGFIPQVVYDFFHQQEHVPKGKHSFFQCFRWYCFGFLREFLNFVNWAMFLDNMSKPHLGYLGGRCFYQLTVMIWDKKLYNPTCKLVAIITHEPPRTEKGVMFY